MVIKLPRSRESTPVAVTPPSTTLAALKVKLQGRQGATAAVPSDVSGGGL